MLDFRKQRKDIFLSNLIPLAPPHSSDLLQVRAAAAETSSMGCTKKMMLKGSEQGTKVAEEVESLRRWGAEHILAFWSWLVGIITLFLEQCGEYGFPWGKNGGNCGVFAKSGKSILRVSAQQFLIKTQFCLWASWFLMNAVNCFFRTVGVLKLSALFTLCRYPLFTIHKHGQGFLWAWWKVQPWLPSLEISEREEMLRAFWLRVKWRHENSGLETACMCCFNEEGVSKSRFSFLELEASWPCSIAGRKR